MKAVVPPPLVMLICGVLMWVMDRLMPSRYFEVPYRGILPWVILFCGFFLFWSGAIAILRRKTTIHPDRKSLQQPTTLVTTGVYRYTRNPIYLGMAITLVAWFIFLQNWLTLVFVIAFIAFITQYQIKPEEQALEKIFGDEYVRYKVRVRRWL